MLGFRVILDAEQLLDQKLEVAPSDTLAQSHVAYLTQDSTVYYWFQKSRACLNPIVKKNAAFLQL